jgi:hypothetical protein
MEHKDREKSAENSGLFGGNKSSSFFGGEAKKEEEKVNEKAQGN